MDKKFLLASIAGGLSFFFVGYLLYGVLLMGFYEANVGSATGVAKEVMDFWALGLGQLGFAVLLTYVFTKGMGVTGFGAGMKAGAILGFWIAFGWDFTIYGSTNIHNLTLTVVDLFVFAALSGISGGVIGMVLGTGGDSGGGSSEAYSSSM